MSGSRSSESAKRSRRTPADEVRWQSLERWSRWLSTAVVQANNCIAAPLDLVFTSLMIKIDPCWRGGPVTLVWEVGPCSSFNRAVDQRRQLEHHTLTNRQPKELRRTGVMFSCQPKPVTRWAAAFWTDCRQLKSALALQQYRTMKYSNRLPTNACVRVLMASYIMHLLSGRSCHSW